MAEVVAEAFLSGVFNVLIDRLVPHGEVLNFLRGQRNDGGRQIVQILKKLKSKLLVIRAVLDDAENKQFTNQAVKDWLDELKHVVYQADDLLDKINYQALRCKVEAEYEKDPIDKARDSTSTPANSFDPEIESKLEEIIDLLNDFVKEKDVLGLREVARRNWSGFVPSTSLVDESSVYGRENDKEEIIKLLLSDEASDIAIGVIPIVGMGGVGKTTLAQLVFNDSRVKKHFEKKAWVCVSDEFDIARVTKLILENVTKSTSSTTDLDGLQVTLKDELNGKKFLIVLDDIWNENYDCWDFLRRPLISGARGSKIIVTTRNRRVADMITAASTSASASASHNLQELSEEHCWSLFAKIAFGNGDSSDYPVLEKIGRKIVKKCKGLPLAAKVLGGLLRCSNLDAKKWNNILESEIWNLPEDKNEIFPVLKLSYDYLSSQSKQCFAYCSVFPKNYKFGKQWIVQMWIAQDFVQQSKDNKTKVKSGDETFQELESIFFFQQSSEFESYFVMHDLIHDLAQYVAGQFSLSLKNMKLDDISEKVRHISYDKDAGNEIDTLKASDEVKWLRTFIVLNPRFGPRDSENRKTGKGMFPTMSCLRVLIFPFSDTSEFSNWIGNMIHLRYLDLSWSTIVELPESICNLHNLQTLSLEHCFKLIKLPENIGKLHCLRHLYNSSTRLVEMPRQITRLSGLQHLTCFVVGMQSGMGINGLQTFDHHEGEFSISNLLNVRSWGDTSAAKLEEKKGLGINGLQAFDHLEGELSISNLHNVTSREDALAAKLKEKKLLRELTLEWGNEGHDDSQHEKGVLENLEPHKNLEKLKIINYGGTMFPDWLGDHSFSNIICLRLHNCRHCIRLPPLGQLPSLRELTIEDMESITEVGLEFYGSSDKHPFQSLKKLCFRKMKLWKEWSPPISGAEEFFSQLETLVIEDCPELTGPVPAHIPSLVELEIRGCPKLLPFPVLGISSKLQRVKLDDFENIETLSDGIPREDHGRGGLISSVLQRVFQSLSISGGLISSVLQRVFQSLSISGCSNMVVGAPNLTSLSLRGCSKLKLLPKRMDSLLPSLSDLCISGCPEIEPFPEGCLPSNLHSLKIVGCRKLKALPKQMSALPSLQYLYIGSCSEIQSFPPLPSTLKSFTIQYLPNLKSLGSLHLLVSLQLLAIEICPKLESLPEDGLPPSLNELHILGCPLLEPRLQRDNGDEWHKIAHIRDIQIG